MPPIYSITKCECYNVTPAEADYKPSVLLYQKESSSISSCVDLQHRGRKTTSNTTADIKDRVD